MIVIGIIRRSIVHKEALEINVIILDRTRIEDTILTRFTCKTLSQGSAKVNHTPGGPETASIVRSMVVMKLFAQREFQCLGWEYSARAWNGMRNDNRSR